MGGIFRPWRKLHALKKAIVLSRHPDPIQVTWPQFKNWQIGIGHDESRHGLRDRVFSVRNLIIEYPRLEAVKVAANRIAYCACFAEGVDGKAQVRHVYRIEPK